MSSANSNEVPGRQDIPLKKDIRLVDAVSLVVGSMVGSGIFIVGADIMRNIGSAGGFVGVWILAGVMTLIAALSYAELSAMFPRAGGQYVYLKEAYSPAVAFVYGWSLFAVIQTGTIAAVGVSFFKFLAYFQPALSEDLVCIQFGRLSISPAQLAAVALIGLLTFFNTQGIKSGSMLQTLFTFTKVISIGGLVIFGFIHIDWYVWQANWADAWRMEKIIAPDLTESYSTLPDLAGGIASALVGAIMSYEAWNNVTFVAGEIRNPKRNIGLSLFIGVLLVTGIYVFLNVMFTAVLPLHEIAIAERDRVGIVASQAIFGNVGTAVMAVLMMIATFGCNNGLILSGARVYYTMAQDKLFFRSASYLNKYAVPAAALWFQALMASILCLSGEYGDLLDMITFVAVFFYVLTILGIYRLRRNKPNMKRPYRAVGYPVLPFLYIVLGLSFCVLLVIYKPNFTWPGLLIAFAGLPIHYVLKRRGGTLN